MQMLLDGLDTSTHQSPRKRKDRAHDDLSVLLDGAENWDWTDMEADFMTPIKKAASPSKVVDLFLIHTQSNIRQRSPHKRRSPVKPPVTPRRGCSRTGQKRDVNLSLSALVEGAETWDWEDMEVDFLTPSRSRDKLKVQCYRIADSYPDLDFSQLSLPRNHIPGPLPLAVSWKSSKMAQGLAPRSDFLSSLFASFTTLQSGAVGENSATWVPTFSHTPRRLGRVRRS